jgi:hypothetical protein
MISGRPNSREEFVALQRICRGIAVISMTVALSACSAPSAPISDTSPPSTTANSTPTTAAAPERVTRGVAPEGHPSLQSSLSAWTNCDGDIEVDNLNNGNRPIGQIFNPVTGTNSAIPRPAPTAGEEILRESCTVTATSDGAVHIVVVQLIKTLSEGLTPESERVQFTSYRQGTDRPILAKTTSGLSSFQGTRALKDGFAVVTKKENGGYIQEIAIFDLQTLEPRTTAQAPTETAFVLMDGWVDIVDEYVTGYGNTNALRFFNGTDGAEVGFVTPVDQWAALPHGFIYEHQTKAHTKNTPPPPDGVFYFDLVNRESVGPIAPADYDEYSWYGDLLLIEGGDDDSEYLVVYDLKERREVLRVNGEQLDGLNIEDAHIGGDYLYLVNDSDNPVIDIRTSEKVSTGWSLRPTAKLVDDWVMLLPESPGGLPSNDNGLIQRGSSGPYAGPWF